MTINSQTQIRELINVVHDLWFSVETLTLCEGTKSLTIELEPRKRDIGRPSAKRVYLVIKHVEEIAITDTEKVRDYDINQITFDPSRNNLVITCGIPLIVEIRVNRLEIQVNSPVDP